MLSSTKFFSSLLYSRLIKLHPYYEVQYESLDTHTRTQSKRGEIRALLMKAKTYIPEIIKELFSMTDVYLDSAVGCLDKQKRYVT